MATLGRLLTESDRRSALVKAADWAAAPHASLALLRGKRGRVLVPDGQGADALGEQKRRLRGDWLSPVLIWGAAVGPAVAALPTVVVSQDNLPSWITQPVLEFGQSLRPEHLYAGVALLILSFAFVPLAYLRGERVIDDLSASSGASQGTAGAT